MARESWADYGRGLPGPDLPPLSVPSSQEDPRVPENQQADLRVRSKRGPDLPYPQPPPRCPVVCPPARRWSLSLIHISEPTRRTPISYAVFCLKKKKNTKNTPTYIL